MDYAQKTAIAAMLNSIKAQIDTVQVLLNLTEAAPSGGKGGHRTQRLPPEVEEDTLSAAEEERLEREIRQQQIALQRTMMGEMNGAEHSAKPAGDEAFQG